jgi:putative phosphoribosyl transferase
MNVAFGVQTLNVQCAKAFRFISFVLQTIYRERTMAVSFADRRDAGDKLSDKLKDYENRSDLFVLALPRGGVPVAYEVATALRAPLDVFLVRKLGVPGHEELAMGAIASGGVSVLNEDVTMSMGISDSVIREVKEHEQKELERREQLYRGSRGPLNVQGRTVILIDDGLATGSTMRAAIAALRKMRPARIVVAVPVAAPETCETIRNEVDELICAVTPEPFLAVGAWYSDFSQTTDDEVRELLQAAARDHLEVDTRQHGKA